MRVPKDIQTVIDELSSDPKYNGECPCCGESFKLKDVGLFYSDNLSPEANACVTNLEMEILELKGKYKKKEEKIKKGAPKKSLEVNVGNIVEKVAPTLAGFPYRINDCRFMSEPIDYVVFNGVTTKGKVEDLIFMDIKTGKARLNAHQKLIKNAIDHGRVEQILYR